MAKLKEKKVVQFYYRTLYRCAICGESVETGSYSKSASESYALSVARNPGSKGLDKFSSEPHKCKDGSYGVGVFSGMEKLVGEETEQGEGGYKQDEKVDDGVVRK